MSAFQELLKQIANNRHVFYYGKILSDYPSLSSEDAKYLEAYSYGFLEGIAVGSKRARSENGRFIKTI